MIPGPLRKFRELNCNWVHPLQLAAPLILAIHRAPKPEGLDCRDAPLRSAAVDEVEGLPRGGYRARRAT